MLTKYLLVDKEILPSYYEKVIEAKSLISSGKAKDVSEATKIVGISRSTYYKYKDYVFYANTDTGCRKAVISCTLYHKSGVLGEVLNVLSVKGANILTITQNMPVNNRAHVVLSIDVSKMVESVEEINNDLGKIDGVSHVKLVALE